MKVFLKNPVDFSVINRVLLVGEYISETNCFPDCLLSITPDYTGFT